MLLKKLDWYIIKKFLGAFFLSIALIISIAIVFDISEKLDDFMDPRFGVTMHEIVFDYYLNFIPYFVNLFAPLFTFISVILFTSKLADNTEIIAILASGISYRRMMFPYMVVAALIAVMTFYLSGYVIPPSNTERIEFQQKLTTRKRATDVSNMQMKVEPNVVLTIKSFNKISKTGFNASLDKFDDKNNLVSRMTANTITYDTLHKWHMHGYVIRDFDGLYEKMTRGTDIDTVLNVEPDEFFVYAGMEEQMTNKQLSHFIERQKSRGMGEVKAFEIEYAKRFAAPFASFILTIIGVSLSSRKVRGGMGANLGIGLALSFLYIMFFTLSSSFAVSGAVPPVVAAWLPNIVYFFIAGYVYSKAQK
ncbi:MAG: LptF/LptG family permease [Paludibacteraceae bacterium]|nr:LptF/LptG family permease [Paludibacteraceae bacterium]MBR6105264.1 LptF/LptG family permease [Paludibacteraceae bacterium]